MNKYFIIILLLGSFTTRAQSLRDALFSGKLKNDPGTVIHKTDDLSAKIDTARKAPDAASLKTKNTSVAGDSNQRNQAKETASAEGNLSNPQPRAADDSATSALSSKDAAPKNNNILWKQHVDSLNATLKTEVLNSKKVKSGTYYVTVSYSIGTDGSVEVTDVFISPESPYLQQQLKERLNIDTPHLSPAVSSTGVARKVSKKYNFTLTK